MIHTAKYNKAKLVKVGSTISCPNCNRLFLKKTYQHVFCSNTGSYNCKDRYWNKVDVSRHRHQENQEDQEHPFSDDAFNIR